MGAYIPSSSSSSSAIVGYSVVLVLVAPQHRRWTKAPRRLCHALTVEHNLQPGNVLVLVMLLDKCIRETNGEGNGNNKGGNKKSNQQHNNYLPSTAEVAAAAARVLGVAAGFSLKNGRSGSGLAVDTDEAFFRPRGDPPPPGDGRFFLAASSSSSDSSSPRHSSYYHPLLRCSALKCADTDFSVPDGATFGAGPPVCASRSALPLDGACGPKSATSGGGNRQWAAVRRYCAEAGTRLCTLEEATRGLGWGTGCGGNEQYFWTATPCAGFGGSRAQQHATKPLLLSFFQFNQKQFLLGAPARRCVPALGGGGAFSAEGAPVCCADVSTETCSAAGTAPTLATTASSTGAAGIDADDGASSGENDDEGGEEAAEAAAAVGVSLRRRRQQRRRLAAVPGGNNKGAWWQKQKQGNNNANNHRPNNKAAALLHRGNGAAAGAKHRPKQQQKMMMGGKEEPAQQQPSSSASAVAGAHSNFFVRGGKQGAAKAPFASAESSASAIFGASPESQLRLADGLSSAAEGMSSAPPPHPSGGNNRKQGGGRGGGGSGSGSGGMAGGRHGRPPQTPAERLHARHHHHPATGPRPNGAGETGVGGGGSGGSVGSAGTAPFLNRYASTLASSSVSGSGVVVGGGGGSGSGGGGSGGSVSGGGLFGTPFMAKTHHLAASSLVSNRSGAFLSGPWAAHLAGEVEAVRSSLAFGVITSAATFGARAFLLKHWWVPGAVGCLYTDRGPPLELEKRIPRGLEVRM
jgi:hypothetical protein